MIERLRLDAVPPPVSAEVHYSRVPAHRWDDELRKVRAAGVTVVATYAIWIHHEQVAGQLRLDGPLDLRRFVESCRRHDLTCRRRDPAGAPGRARLPARVGPAGRSRTRG